MKNLFFIILLSVFTFCSSYRNEGSGNAYYSAMKEQIGYQLDQPSAKHILGLELDEISGIHFINDSEIAAIHDEEGRIFIYNWDKKKVTDRIKFGKSGDYEDIELVDNIYYVIKSNGNIYQVDRASPDKTKEYKTPIKASNDAEGLTYYPESNSLLIALKGQGQVDKNKADGKGFYQFSLDEMELSKDPLFTIRKKELRKALSDSLATLYGDNIDFSPSGIAIHPISQKIHIISSHGKWMVILNNDFTIHHVIPLDKKIFKQPEGITFKENGDLYISNEAVNGSANILKFEYYHKDE